MAPMSLTDTVTTWLASFGAALEARDLDGVLALFGDACFWRDLVAFTWNVKTMEGKEEIRAMLEATLAAACPINWQIQGEAAEANGSVNAFITFETAVARGRGHLRLVDGKCFTLLTLATELKGFEEKLGSARPAGCEYGAQPGREAWGTKVTRERAELGHVKQPYVVVIGGSSCGVMLAARLAKLGVPTIVVDKNASPGDTWRNRYDALHLHTPSFADAFPYMPYPEDWPTYPPKVA